MLYPTTSAGGEGFKVRGGPRSEGDGGSGEEVAKRFFEEGFVVVADLGRAFWRLRRPYRYFERKKKIRPMRKWFGIFKTYMEVPGGTGRTCV